MFLKKLEEILVRDLPTACYLLQVKVSVAILKGIVKSHRFTHLNI